MCDLLPLFGEEGKSEEVGSGDEDLYIPDKLISEGGIFLVIDLQFKIRGRRGEGDGLQLLVPNTLSLLTAFCDCCEFSTVVVRNAVEVLVLFRTVLVELHS